MENQILLKDQLFNPERIRFVSGLIKGVYSDFDETAFLKKVIDKLPELELKQRIAWMRECLHEFLPQDYEKALNILLRALPEECDPTKTDDDFGSFILAPFSDFVATYGCEEQYVDISLSALQEMTKRFSAEDSIRFFIREFPERTLNKMSEWSLSDNYHVRRLASEGSRPRLPWSQKVHLDNREVISKILDNLYFDKTRYVVRSVANHLNDISKDDPGLVISTLKRWTSSNKQNQKEMDYLTRHSLRTLIKAGSPYALELLGYSHDTKVNVDDFQIQNDEVLIGGALDFSFALSSDADEKLMIDYIVHFRGKNGALRPKVFKIRKTTIKADESILVKKKHPLRIMTTKKLYPGLHKVDVQINGRVFEGGEFELKI